MRGATWHFIEHEPEDDISTHTPHAGCDPTLPCRRKRSGHFNSHTPCGVRPSLAQPTQDTPQISTHTPHAGCDQKPSRSYYDGLISTHTPHAGCDIFGVIYQPIGRISTHTPHAGCDVHINSKRLHITYFNSHTPCGVRPSAISPIPNAH